MSRPAESLEVLRRQVNLFAPKRSKVSDGGLGDAAHAARTSDHNPDSTGTFHARDFTHDPKGGFDAYWFAEMLRATRDPRIKYVISAGRMFNGTVYRGVPAWTWQKYTGENGHFHHTHVSVWEGARGELAEPWAGFGTTVMGDLVAQMSDDQLARFMRAVDAVNRVEGQFTRAVDTFNRVFDEQKVSQVDGRKLWITDAFMFMEANMKRAADALAALAAKK